MFFLSKFREMHHLGDNNSLSVKNTRTYRYICLFIKILLTDYNLLIFTRDTPKLKQNRSLLFSDSKERQGD